MADVHAVVNRSTPSNSPLSTVSLFIVSTPPSFALWSEMKPLRLHTTWTTWTRCTGFLQAPKPAFIGQEQVDVLSVGLTWRAKILFASISRSRSNLGRVSRMADVHAVVNRSTPPNSPLSTVSLFIVSTPPSFALRSEMKPLHLHTTWTTWTRCTGFLQAPKPAFIGQERVDVLSVGWYLAG